MQSSGRPGRIAEQWEQLDRLALMQQLGVLPTPGKRHHKPYRGSPRAPPCPPDDRHRDPDR
jgi:hypothetical protein